MWAILGIRHPWEPLLSSTKETVFFTNVSVFDLQSRLPALSGQKRKKQLFSGFSLPGLDEDVFLANVTVRIVLPKQMVP